MTEPRTPKENPMTRILGTIALALTLLIIAAVSIPMLAYTGMLPATLIILAALLAAHTIRQTITMLRTRP